MDEGIRMKFGQRPCSQGKLFLVRLMAVRNGMRKEWFLTFEAVTVLLRFNLRTLKGINVGAVSLGTRYWGPSLHERVLKPSAFLSEKRNAVWDES